MNTLEDFEKSQADSLSAKREIPKFAPGDTLRVSVRVVEGTRERSGKRARIREKQDQRGKASQPKANTGD